MNKFLLWWHARLPREQGYLFMGGVVVGLLLLYFILLAPLNLTVNNLQNQVLQQQTLVQWLTPRIPVLQRWLQKDSVAQPVTVNNLLATIDTRLKQSELVSSGAEISQVDGNTVRISFKHVPFDALMNWLAQQWQQSRIAVVQIDVQKSDDVGMAQVTVTLGL